MPWFTQWWGWEEAFDKFGFEDGDGVVHTELVADFLTKKGYENSYSGGLHNTYFDWILCPCGMKIKCNGYDDPRIYLTTELIKMLDTYFDRNYKEKKGDNK